MNKSILAWLYYNKLHPDRYNDLDDYQQRRRAERAFTKLKKIDNLLIIECLVIYYKMMVFDIEDILKNKIPKA